MSVHKCFWTARGLCGSNKFIPLGLIPTLLLQPIPFFILFYFFFLLGEGKKEEALAHVMFVCAHLSQAAGRCVKTMNYGWSCWNAGIDLFYSSLSSTHWGTGKTQNLPIFCAWEVSPGLYRLKLGKERSWRAFTPFQYGKFSCSRGYFSLKNSCQRQSYVFLSWKWTLLQHAKVFFLGLRRRDALPSRPGTVHATGAEFLCGLEQDLCFVWIFVFPIPGKELLIFPLQCCFQASWIIILQGLIIWHRSPCSSGVWHWCHSKQWWELKKKLFLSCSELPECLTQPYRGRVAVNQHLLSSGCLHFQFMPL